MEPGLARSWRREATLTLSPMTVYSMRSSVPTVPATTSPRLTPIPTSNGSWPIARRRAASAAMALRMSSAVFTARAAWSGYPMGAEHGHHGVAEELVEGAVVLEHRFDHERVELV